MTNQTPTTPAEDGPDECNGNCLPSAPIYDAACPYHGARAMVRALDDAAAEAGPALEGRALDAEVARVVFGYEVFRCGRVHFAGIPCDVMRYRVRSDEEPDHISSEPAVPPYSTDWSAAGLLIEHFPRIVVSKYPGMVRVYIWPTWPESDESGPMVMVEAETGPLAIARAAALAAREERGS